MHQSESTLQRFRMETCNECGRAHTGFHTNWGESLIGSVLGWKQFMEDRAKGESETVFVSGSRSWERNGV